MNIEKKPNSLRSFNKQSSTILTIASTTLLSTISTNTFAAEKEESVTAKLEGIVVSEDVLKSAANPYAEKDSPYKINRSANSKFTESLLNTSKTISVIGKEQIEDANTTSLKALMQSEPGITLGTGEGGNALGDRFFIRGFDARNDVFVDGLRDPGVTSREIFATEQVEISKGPSSTFGGRGTTGGAVNSVSKKPQDQDFTTTKLQLGDEQRVTIDTNKVINDRLSVRANILYHDATISNNDDRHDRRKGLALAADYLVNDSSNILLEYYHVDTDSMPGFGHPWDTQNNQPYDLSNQQFYGVLGRDFQNTSADIITGTYDKEISPYTRFVTKTRIGETTNEYIVGAPENTTFVPPSTFLSAPTGFIYSRPKSAGFKNKFIGNNTQINHEKYINDIEHTFTVGIDISKEEITNQPFSNTFGNILLNIENPDNNTGSGTVSRLSGKSNLIANSYSLYFMDTIDITPKWHAFGGLRYDNFDIENIGFDYLTNSKQPAINYNKGFVNGHLGLIYKPVEHASIYTSISTSSNLPGEMYDGVSDVDYGGLVAGMENVKPEQNINFEVGTKWDVLDNKLNLGAAIYHLRKSNKVESERATDGSFNILQTGEIKVSGIEFSAAGNLTPKLSLSGGLSFMDTEVTDSIVASNIGTKLANIAERSASLQLKYQLTPKMAFGGTWVHKGEINGGTFAANTGRKLPASNRLDLMAEYQVNKKLSARLNIKNATDETIYDALYRNDAPFTFVAPGRTINLGISYKF